MEAGQSVSQSVGVATGKLPGFTHTNIKELIFVAEFTLRRAS
jgi:hypothetical protein